MWSGRLHVVRAGKLNRMPHLQAKRRMDEHNCVAVMVGRGALITPWIFESWRTGQELLPTAEERVDIYRQFVSHMKVNRNL